MATNKTTNIEQISECFVKPNFNTAAAEEESKNQRQWHLSPWDLAMLSANYIQKGILFSKPPNFNVSAFLYKLQLSLSFTLAHFHPLAGRLRTARSQNPPSCVVYVDSDDSPGARFVHASASTLSISDLLDSIYVPEIVQFLFDHHKALNHDGHELSLLTVQVTELIDGIFIGCSMNHAVGDGSSFWNFFNSFSEIFQSLGEGEEIDKSIDVQISRPPILNRWIPDGYGEIVRFPFADIEQLLSAYDRPDPEERMFYISSESISRLKSRANFESETANISSLKALSAFLWRCITRIRRTPENEITTCRLACNNRSRLNPPLSDDYFGNCLDLLRASTTAGELLSGDLGSAASKVHQAVADHSDERIRGGYDEWIKSPTIHNRRRLFDPNCVVIGSSPRFNKYGPEFGLGKGLAVRSGYANKFSGKVTVYPGRDGGGSMELETCLPPESMAALESDQEFAEVFRLNL